MHCFTRISFFLLLSLMFVTLFSCRNKTQVIRDEAKEPSIEAAGFNADSAFAFVEKQVSFSPRVPGSTAHKKCAAWLETTLKRYTATVVRQSFTMKAYDGSALSLTNLIASYNPDHPVRILLTAHWDSRPYADNDPDPANHRKPIDGANDGGSGTGILLEIARQLSMKAPAVGVDILLLDGEDYGAPQDIQNSETGDDWALGSQYWSKNPHVDGYKARYGILLDMVGAGDAIFTHEYVSMYYAPDIVNKVWNVASQIGYSSYFSNESTNAITDDHVYINRDRNIPTIDIIQYDAGTRSTFYKYWHTMRDNLEGIDRNTLKAVGQTVLTTVYLEQ